MVGIMLLAAMGLAFVGHVRADVCDSLNAADISDPNDPRINQCVTEWGSTLDAISKANTNNKQQLQGLQTQITRMRSQIKGLEGQLNVLSKGIFDREVKVGVKQGLLAAKVRQDYVRKREQPTLLVLFAADSAAEFFREMEYRERLARMDQGLIDSLAAEIRELTNQSSQLTTQKNNLDALKVKTDKQAQWLAGEVAKASQYEADLGGKISALTAMQQELLAEKTGTYATSVGDVPLADDPNSRPDYNPGFSPAFAAFSFGAPHFKGMSQYGALGRAKAGQGYEQILKDYYGNIRIADVNTSLTMKTTAGSMSFEDRYMKGIAEMPSQWGNEGGMEALKAQAIAARSYALAYTGWRMGSQSIKSTICVTESCQVWKSSKADNPGAWAQAVNDTRGKIIVSNNSNEVVNAWYASTSGGYQQSYSSLGHATPGFWDTTSDWTRWADGAWEVKGGSPWFYKGWYKSRSGKTCGRSSPWLHEDEFADIVNAAIIVAAGGDISGILPEDVRSCLGGSDNPWSKSRMAEEADKYGGRVTAVSAVRVEHGSNGLTSKVIISTNRGEINISGANFKKAFNLRAPGEVALKSGLFNIEKK
jgi:peptidoglycan hydrolase CwlO-like protein